MATPCAVKLNEQFPEVTQEQAEQILLRAKNMALERALASGENIEKAMESVTEGMIQRDKLFSANAKRGTYLNQAKEQDTQDFVKRFPEKGLTIGDGLKAYAVGGKYAVDGSRLSIDVQHKTLNQQFFGRLTAQMEEAGVFVDFWKNRITKEIYQEMGELVPNGKPGASGNPNAQKIAGILDNITKEMNARLNDAGALIYNLPGYVVRQTHDVFKIRAAGKTKQEALVVWKNFVKPLLDSEKTFLGADKDKFLNMVFNDLHTGVKGVMRVEGQGVGHRAIADRWQQERVLHFKDSESAWAYNEKFGQRDFMQQVMTDIGNKARAIALMENLGPNAEASWLNSIRMLKEWARERPDSTEQIDSINEHELMAYFHQLTGEQDIPTNPSLARTAGNIRAVTQMAKMGGVALTNLFTDNAFMHPEMAYQGISHLDTLGKQLTMLAKKTPEEKATLRMMGVGLDGLLGNILNRYSATGPVSGPINKFQKTFFDINFSNFITDATKSAAAELMATHLGQHADVNFADLPPELSQVLGLYDISAKEWNLLRSTAYEHPSGNWGKVITADQVSKLTDTQILTLHKGEGVPSAKAIIKMRERLETQLRAYFTDRVDYAAPTPGGAERALTTLDTKAGTGLGEAIRLLMLFKSFPVTVANKIIQREVYGRGAMSAKQWLMNDHQGKFNLAQLIAMTTVAGYLGMTIRDALRGRTPRELITDGKINLDVLGDSAIQGGGLGIMGEMITRDYGQGMGSFLENAAGPVFGQLNKLAEMKTKASEGEDISGDAYKMALDNTPLINLFYARPILNYFVLWNLQEMMDPGSLKKTEENVRANNNQDFYLAPSETLNK